MLYPYYVFDAYGTLFDVHAAVGRHHQAIGPKAPALSALWRSKQLEYTWVRSLSQNYKNFYDLTCEALDVAAAQITPLAPEVRAALLDAYLTLDPYPDVLPTLQALKKAGAHIVVFSNGTEAMLTSAVAAAGLSEVIDQLVSVDHCRIYKTSPLAYAFLCSACGIDADQLSFQSSNRWDIAGARAMGWRCLWVNRTNQPDEYTDLPAARTITRLSAVLDDLAHLAREER
jgi:2-haloacid dehalogenase